MSKLNWGMAHFAIHVEGWEAMGPLNVTIPVPWHVRHQAVELLREERIPIIVAAAVDVASNGRLISAHEPKWTADVGDFLPMSTNEEFLAAGFGQTDLDQMEIYYNGYFTPEQLAGEVGPLMGMEDAISALVTHYRNVRDLTGSRPVAIMVPTYILTAMEVAYEESQAHERE